MSSETLPVSEAKSRLNELARQVHREHARVTLTRNGVPEVVMLDVDDLAGLEMTLETLADAEATARISESLSELAAGDEGVDAETVRADLARRRNTGQ